MWVCIYFDLNVRIFDVKENEDKYKVDNDHCHTWLCWDDSVSMGHGYWKPSP